jgi:3',5'-cyclic-AMP phosphodiesterase
MKRRDFLSNTFLSAAAATGIATTAAAATTPSVNTDLSQDAEGRRRVIRIAHLTDIHVKPDKIAEEGMARALRNANALSPKPDFIVNSGDCIMDALEKTKEETAEQWKVYKRILKSDNSLPVVHAIGNHDIWGWFSKVNGLQADKLYGKQWAIEELGLPKRYYSFEKAGWKFIILDSVQLNPAGGYIAYLDAEQYAWLENELKTCAPTKHISIVSHVPILSMCSAMFFGKNETNGDLLIKRNQMHTDFFKLKSLFKNYPNIRVCLSGHVHLQDEVKFLGITYYCNGAVSGAWWKGPYQDFPPAYAIVDYYDDGSFERCFVNY